MTTICTDGVTFAADTQSLFGDEIAAKRAQKITVQGGCVFGLAGSAGMTKPVIAWYLDGADPKEVPPTFKCDGWSMLVADGEKLFYLTDDCPYPVEVGPPFAIGSGEKIASTAMHCGKTPAEAVALAIKLMAATGGEVDVINIAEALAQSQMQIAAE